MVWSRWWFFGSFFLFRESKKCQRRWFHYVQCVELWKFCLNMITYVEEGYERDNYGGHAQYWGYFSGLGTGVSLGFYF